MLRGKLTFARGTQTEIVGNNDNHYYDKYNSGLSHIDMLQHQLNEAQQKAHHY